MSMDTPAPQRKWIALIIFLYVALGLVYALATPPLESSDEYKHYPVVQHIQTMHELPVLEPESPGRWLQEAAQPPLYYLLMAGVTWPLDTTDLPELHTKNEFAFIGNPNQVGNKNLIIHDPVQEKFPWQGSVLAIYLIRFASILFGAGSIYLTFLLGATLFSPRIGLFAAALTAFNPMFLFVSAAVNNDSLSILLAHLGLFLLVKIWQERPAPTQKWGWYLLLGIVLGCGILTKLSLGGLLGLAGLMVAWIAWQERDWKYLFVGGLMTLFVALIISAWWFVRNWQIYSNLTGLNVFVAVQGTRDAPLTLQGWWEEFGTLYRSFWGLFGGVNITAPEIVYQFLNLFAVVGAVGLFWQWVKGRTHFVRTGGWLLLLWTAVIFVLLIRWNLISPAFQGRLLFPALGAINVLLGVGVLGWIPERWQRQTAIGFSGLLLVIALLLPWITIRPVYALPQPLTAVPVEAQLEEPITFVLPNGRMQLVGVEMEADQHIEPDEPVVVTAYWQLTDAVLADYLSSAHLLGRDFESVGSVNRHPALGMIPTSRWQVGEIYQDVYHIYAQDDAALPTQLAVSLSLYDLEASRPVPATNPEGVLIDPLLVGEKAFLHADEPSAPDPNQVLQIPFADGVNLIGVDLPETAVSGSIVPITFYWQANETLPTDYTVFVQLLDGNREWIAGADAPPVNNFFPTTGWQKGDVVDDTHWLTIPAELPAGEYPVLVGLYDPATGARLPRQDGHADFVELTLVVEE